MGSILPLQHAIHLDGNDFGAGWSWFLWFLRQRVVHLFPYSKAGDLLDEYSLNANGNYSWKTMLFFSMVYQALLKIICSRCATCFCFLKICPCLILWTMLLLFGEVVNGEMFPKAICRSLGGAFSGCPGWLGHGGWAKPAIFIYHPNGEKCAASHG